MLYFRHWKGFRTFYPTVPCNNPELTAIPVSSSFFLTGEQKLGFVTQIFPEEEKWSKNDTSESATSSAPYIRSAFSRPGLPCTDEQIMWGCTNAKETCRSKNQMARPILETQRSGIHSSLITKSPICGVEKSALFKRHIAICTESNYWNLRQLLIKEQMRRH